MSEYEDLKRCPKCGAVMDANIAEGYFECGYCGYKVPLEESDSVRKYRIDASAYSKVEIDKHKTIKEIENARKNAEIEKESQATNRTFIRSVLIGLVIIAALAVGLFFFLKNTISTNLIHKGDARITSQIIQDTDRSYKELEGDFSSAGFENVSCVALNDLNEKLYKKDGIVSKITVNGSTAFQLNEWYEPDTEVIISYHSVNSELNKYAMPFESSDYYLNRNYEGVKTEMEEAGFKDIRISPSREKNKGDKSINNVKQITIKNKDYFTYYDKFDETDVVTITYYAAKPFTIWIEKEFYDEYINAPYEKAVTELKNMGFINVSISPYSDNSLFGFLNNEGAVHDITFDGHGKNEYDGKNESVDAKDTSTVIVYYYAKDNNKKEEEQTSDDKIEITTKEKELIGKDYSNVKNRFLDWGFTNVETEPDQDLNPDALISEQKKDGIVFEITVKGDTSFTGKKYSSGDIIRIKYHSYPIEAEIKENQIKMDISSKKLLKMNLQEAKEKLEQLGFKTIKEEALPDIKKGITGLLKKDGQLESITIGGAISFDEKAIFESDDEVIIVYHTYEEEVVETVELKQGEIQIPYSVKELKKKDYQEITTLLSDLGFKNIEITPIYDVKTGITGVLKKDGDIERISIGDNSSFKKDDVVNLNSKVVISYHTLAEKEPIELKEDEIQMPYSAKELKKMNYTEIQNTLKELGFNNIKVTPIYDVKSGLTGLLKKDGDIEKVKIGDNESFKKNDIVSLNSEVVIEYHTAEK